jgi:UDP-glucose 4-epimerase
MEQASTTLDAAWLGKRVLVTGGAGFIGRHLVRALHAAGAQLGLLLRQPCPEFDTQQVFIGDMRQREFVEAAVADWQPEVVFHLAASRARSLTAAAFAETIDINLIGSLHLLEALEQSPNTRRIVLLGTAEEYGCGPVPFREDVRESPVSAYSLSKLSATHLAQMMAHTLGLPTTVLRPSVAYGPEQHEDMFLPALIRALLRGERFAMTAGEQTRDFVYVDDLVEALGCAGLSADTTGEVINIGGGQAIRIADLVDHVERMTDAVGLTQRGAMAYRPGEAMNYQLDISKAEKLLGWRPCNSLEKGLARTVAWYRAH